MNFRFFILLLFVTSCGLKTDPRAPKNTLLPSIPDSYFTHPPEEEKKEEANEQKPAQ